MIRTSGILVYVACAWTAFAGTNQWTNIGPEGGNLWSIAVDPQDSATVWAGTRVGVFRSSDGGASWTNAGLAGLIIYKVTLDPQRSGTVYAITYGPPNQDGVVTQLFKTVDGGTSWNEVDSGLPQMGDGALAIDPQNPNTLYAVTAAGGLYTGQIGIYKSTDGGVSWTAANTGLPDKFIGRALGIDPANSGTVYAAGYLANAPGIQVFKSIDGGASWSTASAGLPNTSGVTPQGMAVDPNNSNTVYLTSSTGVFKSTNGGASWNPANSGLPVQPNGVINCCSAAAHLDPQSQGTFYVEAGNGMIYKSTDGAASWNSTGAVPAAINSFTIDPRDAMTLYAASWNSGVLKSLDGGVSWSSANAGLRAIQLLSFAADPQNTGTLYAGTDFGMFKSSDGGLNWRLSSAGLKLQYAADWVMALAVDAFVAGNVYAGTGEDECGYGAGGLFRSTDGAETWSAAAGFPVTCMGVLAVDPKNAGTIYAGTWASGIVKSADGGATWMGINKGMPTPPYGPVTGPYITALAIDSQSSDIVYTAILANPGGRLFRSSNGGSTWTPLPLSLTTGNFSFLAADPRTQGVVYAAAATWDGTSGGLWKSSDAGTSWHILPLPSSAGIYAVTVDPQDSGILYAATAGGVIGSSDGGQRWTAIPGNIGAAAVLSWDPEHPNTLYAAGTGGLWAIHFDP